MKFSDIFKLSLNNLLSRPLRSWLTVLGIVIGVAAIVALVSVGEGLQQRVNEQLSGLGSNLITITPGRTRALTAIGRAFEQIQTTGSLTENDLKIVKSIPGVQYANGVVSGTAKVYYAGQTISARIQGVDTSVWRFMETTELEAGRYLMPGDTYVAVVGNRIANDVFKQPIKINSQIKIGDQNFKVVGILKSAGFLGQEDSSVFIPKDTARKILGESSSDQLSSIVVQVSDSANVQDVATEIQNRLMASHHVTENNLDFTVQTAQSIQERVSSVTQTITLFLGGIAGISLIVGGIGIANTMFMSVMERTRLIGVLKALGTTKSEIMKLFLTESIIMGLIGGIIGVFVGILLSGFISEFGISMPMTGVRGAGKITPVVTPQLILFSIAFSIAIGAVSGLLPARRAANLQPVEALRYEWLLRELKI